MVKCRWLLIFLLVSLTYSYRLQCPDFSQRTLRALGYCTSSLRSRYTCLYDTNKLSFTEQCNRNPDFVTPGEKYVLTGNLRNIDCSAGLYQPFRLWSNVSGECLNQKSLCEGEGQIIFNNGSLIGDRTCRCDYTKGYKFIKRPNQNCSCNPSIEDCSCYISKCPDGSILMSDYECGGLKHHPDSNCPLIGNKRDGLQIPIIKMNVENGKQMRTSLPVVIAIIVLILVYIVISFFLLNTDHSKGKDEKAEDFETPSNAETIIHVSAPTYDTQVLVRREHKQLEKENISVDDSLKNGLNEQLKLKEELIKTELEHKRVVELKDAKILELQKLLEEKCKDMKYKEKVIESKTNEMKSKEKEMTEREKKREEQTRDHIKKLERDRRNLHNEIQELKGNIRVFCRVRPFLNYENKGSDCNSPHISIPDQKTIVVEKTVNAALNKNNKVKKTFSFDKVFSHNATQYGVFEEISQLVQSALDGYNVCIFAYGQTGSGKTYTMEGTSVYDDDTRGMIPRSVVQIFDTIQKLTIEGWKYSIDVSCLEIYGKEINDLLCEKKVGQTYEIQDVNNEVCVTNITTERVTTEKEVYQLLQKASEKRKVAETKSNLRSSRSHTVFTLKFTGENSINKDNAKSTLNLVDLAGSERQKTSGTEGQQLQEAIAINLSLSTLGKFIRAIRDKEKVIPYRESKLTQLLHRSIGGNSKTLMFVNVSPKIDCVEETINSLKFATDANQCKKGIAQQNK